MNRREFIQTSSFAVAGMVTLPSFMKVSKAQKTLGLQLYTLKDVIFQDVKGVLKKVADAGYKELETFGYKEGKLFEMPISDFNKYVKSLGMKVTSGHYSLDIVKNDWEKACADAKSIGQEYVVVPWMDKQYYNSLDALKSTIDLLNKAAVTAKKHGLRFSYHNHAFEFEEKFDGKIMYDIMLEELDPKCVSMELDLYWVVRGGHDPLKYFEKHPGRFDQWHVKDMDKQTPEHNTEVGRGSIDFKAIFAKAKQAGLKHYYVEQEYFTIPSVDSIKVSADYLKGIL